MRLRIVDNRLIIGIGLALVFIVAMACSSADDDEVASTAAPAAPPVAQPTTAPTTAPAVQPTQAPPAQAVGFTFWNGLAAKCETRGGNLRLGNRIDSFANLNPATINQVIQFSITAEILGGLMQLDAELKPVPDMATSWSVSSDGLTYRFELRQDAKFHTGRPVTADDWLFTYDHQIDPATQSIHTKGLEGVERPVKIDDFTIEITTAFPRASFLSKVVERASGRVMSLVDSETLAEIGEGGFNRMPVGAGPFKVVEHVLGERLELEAATGTFYDPSVPCLDSITMSNIPDDNTLVAALESGGVDIIYGFPPQFWDRIEASDDLIVDSAPDVGFQNIGFNVRADRAEKIGRETAPWDDINVIYALGAALDRDEFIARAFQGRAIPSYGPIPPGQKFFFRDLGPTSKRAFDLPRAKQLMKDAGYEDGFEFTVLSGTGNRVPLEVLSALWKETLNVIVIPDIQESSIFTPRWQKGEFDAYFTGSGGDPDPDDSIDDWFTDGSKFMFIGYNDEVVNRLNRQQKAEVDINKRLELILELSARMDETYPGIFTHHRILRTAYSKDVKGYQWIHAMRQLEATWLDR